jgi:hypothetical protein
MVENLTVLIKAKKAIFSSSDDIDPSPHGWHCSSFQLHLSFE